jgi:hypothetical protein
MALKRRAISCAVAIINSSQQLTDLAGEIRSAARCWSQTAFPL